MKRARILVFAVLAIVACDRSEESSSRPFEADKAPLGPKEEPVDAEAWCALMIEIHTRHGNMVERRYHSLEPGTMRAAMTESVERYEEIREAAPPQLEEAVQLVDGFYRRLLAAGEAHGWDPPPALSATDAEARAFAKSLEFQQRYCGVGFETPP